MLLGFEFDKIKKENRLEQLNCVDFLVTAPDREELLEKEERISLQPPIFIKGNEFLKERMTSIISSPDRTVSKKSIVSVSDCTLVGCDLLYDIKSCSFISLIGINNAEQIINRHLPSFSGYQFDQAGSGSNKIYYKNGLDIPIKGRGFILHGVEGRNYGSFLFRILPQLLILKELNLDFDFFIVPERTSWLLQAISLLEFGVKPIFTNEETQGRYLQQCMYIQTNDNRGFLSKQDKSRIINFTQSVIDKDHMKFQKRKIYVSRRYDSIKNPKSRKFINEEEMVRHLEKLGFEEVFPEVHPLSSQMSMFFNCDAIIGPAGSGLLNSMFSERETRVLEIEIKPVCLNQHASIYSSTDKTYAFYFGDTNKNDNLGTSWSVNSDDFKLAVNDFISY